jgi:multidrug resistance efflux pump
VSGRRIALLALIGLVPIAIALWIAGYDVLQQIGRYVVAQGVVAGETAILSAPSDGQVVDVEAQPGQRVQAGQTLLRILVAGSSAPTEVAAPKDGTVLQVGVVVGQSVRAGDRLAVLDVSTRLHAVAFVDEKSITAVQPGQRADVDVPALGATYQGVVRQILPAGSVVEVTGIMGTPAESPTAGPTKYPVWIDFEYGNAPIRVAMTVSAKIYR